MPHSPLEHHFPVSRRHLPHGVVSGPRSRSRSLIDMLNACLHVGSRIKLSGKQCKASAALLLGTRNPQLPVTPVAKIAEALRCISCMLGLAYSVFLADGGSPICTCNINFMRALSNAFPFYSRLFLFQVKLDSPEVVEDGNGNRFPDESRLWLHCRRRSALKVGPRVWTTIYHPTIVSVIS